MANVIHAHVLVNQISRLDRRHVDNVDRYTRSRNTKLIVLRINNNNNSNSQDLVQDRNSNNNNHLVVQANQNRQGCKMKRDPESNVAVYPTKIGGTHLCKRHWLIHTPVCDHGHSPRLHSSRCVRANKLLPLPLANVPHRFPSNGHKLIVTPKMRRRRRMHTLVVAHQLTLNANRTHVLVLPSAIWFSHI